MGNLKKQWVRRKVAQREWAGLIVTLLWGGLVLLYGWENRASERVVEISLTLLSTGLASGLAAVVLSKKLTIKKGVFSFLIGAVASASIAIVLSMKDESLTKEFPCVVFLKSGVPTDFRWATDDLPLHELGLDANIVYDDELRQLRKGSNFEIFPNLLLRLILKRLIHTFSVGWDIHFFRMTRPFSELRIYADSSEPYKEVELEELDMVLDSQWFRKPSDDPDLWGMLKMHLPLESQLVRCNESRAQGDLCLGIVNPFVEVSIIVAMRSNLPGLGSYSSLLKVRDEDAKSYGTVQYEIKLQAKYNRWRLGSPKMKLHRKWVENLFDSLQRYLDVNTFGEELEGRHLLYGQQNCS